MDMRQSDFAMAEKSELMRPQGLRLGAFAPTPRCATAPLPVSTAMIGTLNYAFNHCKQCNYFLTCPPF